MKTLTLAAALLLAACAAPPPGALLDMTPSFRFAPLTTGPATLPQVLPPRAW